MDVLYLFATAFFVLLAVRGAAPTAIATVPLAALLYFGWKSSPAFFVAQILSMALAFVLSATGLSPL